MDDGCAVCNINKKTNQVRWRAIHIATYNFNYDEHIIIQKYFKTVWNMDTKIYRDRIYFRLSINAENCKIFIPIIENFMCESMLYKIDLKYNK